MQTYLDQLTRLARRRRVDLLAAVVHAGIADSQFYRWRNGTTTMREASAIKVRAAIEELAHAPAGSIRSAH